LYILLVLPLVYFFVFAYIPMYGAQIAFKRFNPVDGIMGSPWVGLRHFIKFFTSYQFGRIIPNTVLLSFYQLAAGFTVPIILALALNSTLSTGYRKLVQMITYMPHFVSTVVVAGMILQLLNSRIGLYGVMSTLMGHQAVDLLGKPDAFRHIFVWSGVWQNAGWSTIIYMAALSNTDPELHEAAMIDGANRFKRVIHIDIPTILPTATILLIMNAGQIMNLGFEKVYLLQNPLNLRTSEVISTYVYKVGLTGNSDFSYGAAIGLFNSFINLTLISTVNALARRMSLTSLW
jgi:putative aldouronate transport system permease protein